MKTKEIQRKTKQELERLLKESQEKLRGLRFDIQLKQSKNVRGIREIKKLIAQIFTFLKGLK